MSPVGDSLVTYLRSLPCFMVITNAPAGILLPYMDLEKLVRNTSMLFTSLALRLLSSLPSIWLPSTINSHIGICPPGDIYRRAIIFKAYTK
jgi:hypothetical protein